MKTFEGSTYNIGEDIKEPITTKKQLQELLSNNVAIIVFTKMDGTTREMRCTLKPEYLPKKIVTMVSEQQNARANNDLVISVWDMDNDGWRSIRIDRITEEPKVANG